MCEKVNIVMILVAVFIDTFRTMTEIAVWVVALLLFGTIYALFFVLLL